MDNLAIAEGYYKAMGEKNMERIEKYLHPKVEFIGPVAKATGKENVMEAVKKFCAFFKKLAIRETFANGDHAMVVYDVDFPAPIGKFPSAALLKVKDGLITRVELFFDARPFAGL